MLCQIWLAHPQHRTEYMILDPNNWDTIPAPLIETDLIKTTTSSDVPWDI